MKKIIGILSAVLCTFTILSGCGKSSITYPTILPTKETGDTMKMSSERNDSSSNQGSKENIEENVNILFEVNSEADRALNFDSLENLMNQDPDIISGKIISMEAKMKGSLVYTRYEMEVSEVVSGDIKVGDIVYVTALGGTINAAEYFTHVNMKKDFEVQYSADSIKNGFIKSTWDGAWMMELNQEYLIFAQYIDYDNVMTYYPLNSWQGIFRYTPDSLQRYSTKDMDDKFVTSIDIDEIRSLVSP